jgi:hypothetical protein
MAIINQPKREIQNRNKYRISDIKTKAIAVSGFNEMSNVTFVSDITANGQLSYPVNGKSMGYIRSSL